ncbi:MAG: hypothetical protein OEU86_06365, partial [Gammaproteobacteria bacterium]|nr:hypothetical protein [Gammaproteobacteria bacterium]
MASGEQGADGSQRIAALESELEDSRRQLELKDRELEALQQQLAQIGQAEEEAVAAVLPELEAEEGPALDDVLDDQVADELIAEVDEPELAEEIESQPLDVTPAEPVREAPSMIGSLLASPLFYIALIVVLLGGWLVSRKRGEVEEEETGQWEALDAAAPAAAGVVDSEADEATTRIRAEHAQADAFVVEEAPVEDEDVDESAVAAIADDEWSDLGDDAETPLERTISTDSAVSLDRADPIAEADFHMAYGLYDQAAELLTGVISAEPDRTDLRMKLLEVYFIWENQEGFLSAAQDIKGLLGDAGDSDWNKVLIMGKQLCPDASLFLGAAAVGGAVEGVDLEFGDDTGSMTALDFALDADEDEDAGEFAATGMDLDLTGGDSQEEEELGTLDMSMVGEDEITQAVDHDFGTPEVTMEAPTIESPIGESGGGSDTAEIDLDDLGLDLSELEDVAEEQDIDLDLSDGLEDGVESDETLLDPTAALDLGDLESKSEDTREQPVIGDTAEQPVLDVSEAEAVFDVGAEDLADSEPTAEVPEPAMAEGATMTEVGTKLDLARAYIDMGDPDGAKSILAEVLEEAGEGQRQEAQKLLDDLTD